MTDNPTNDTTPADTAPADTTPADAAPAVPAPSDPAPAEAASADAASTAPASSDPAPVDHAPQALKPTPVPPPDGPAPDGAVPPEGGAKPRRRGRVLRIAGGVLLAVAVLGGTGYTVVTVNGADRDAGAPVWEFPATPKDEGRAAKAGEDGGLAGMLVSYEDSGWERGPDIGEFGPEAVLGGERATALRKERLSWLPRSMRKQMEKEIDRQHLTGVAMRSYQSLAGTSWSVTDETLTMSIELAQMESGTTVRQRARAQIRFLDAMDSLRKGPRIKGHKDARCYLAPKDDEEDLDTMVCTAYVGNVLVTASAAGTAPLDTKGAAMLLRRQLDRIQEPGKAV
ncbi:hypothetical protein N4P33_05650 [Streptomyces sp. 15-116A]|uniref:hypothetical protein n=1 Tax=Streptomyces sp. 15-116A TaxID=2259035 RepID=UPI0021B32B5C|nr:hypothetical protein [Streptomyces sp. 15-116A]MCT7351655.1 hypothetical protein [Streptomyces sp. 15-116A]